VAGKGLAQISSTSLGSANKNLYTSSHSLSEVLFKKFPAHVAPTTFLLFPFFFFSDAPRCQQKIQIPFFPVGLLRRYLEATASPFPCTSPLALEFTGSLFLREKEAFCLALPVIFFSFHLVFLIVAVRTFPSCRAPGKPCRNLVSTAGPYDAYPA